MFEGNPVYNLTPTLPPGLSAVPYMVGGLVGPMTGAMPRPYVPPNMSTFDAQTAKYVNDPLYKNVLSGMYGQLGYQIGTTLGGVGFVRDLASMSGYSPGQIRLDLGNMGAAFGRSIPGSMLMPLADSMLDRAGITGGSFVGMTNAVFNNRLHLLSPGTLFSPYNAEQQYQAMSGTSAMLSLLNGLMSQRGNDGSVSLLPNHAVMQGFTRERIASLAMRMAGAGAFSDATGGFGSRLSALTGGFDIGSLNFAANDFTGGGENSNLNKQTAEKVKAFTREFANRMQGGIQAMAAMRDMLKEVDGLEEKLTALTNGNWLRSGHGAYAARDAVRSLHAVTQMYNINPTDAMGQIFQTRGALQTAAGFDESMQFFGFSGGGLFGLPAQTAILANVEDMIRARGVQGDPILADRLRRQGVQAMSRNMNTLAGRGAQVLAYARQVGAVSREEADRLREGFQSGDRAVMDDTLNRLLTTVYGSAKRGREMINDQMYMNGLRMAMNDEAGVYATNLTMRGADLEFLQREKITAAENRLAFSRTALSGAGMNTMQSAAGVDRIVDSVAATLRQLGGADGDRYATAFKEQVTALRGKGTHPVAALNAIVSAFKSNPVTARFGEQIDLAVTRQTAENNEYAFTNGGLESSQASEMARSMLAARQITGQQSAEIFKLIRSGRGSDALSRAMSLMGNLPEASRKMVEEVKTDAAKKYEAAVRTIGDKKVAEQLVDAAGASGFGSRAVVESYNEAIAAATGYLRKGNYDDFWEQFSKSKFGQIFGKDEQNRFLEAVRKKDKGYFDQMGRLSVNLGQLASENLRENGYSLHYSGYYGEGLSSVNSQQLENRRNALLTETASAWEEDSQLSAGDRSTLSQDVVSLVTGEKDWMGVLRLAGRAGKGLQSRLSRYGAAFKEYTDARKAVNDKREGYNGVLKRLSQAGNYDALEYLNTLSKNVSSLNDDDLRKELVSAGLSGDDLETALDALGAQRTMENKRDASEKVLKETVSEKGFTQDYRGFKSAVERDKVAGARASKILDFLDTYDVSKLNKYTGSAMDKAYASIRSVVTDAMVAERGGVTSLKDMRPEDVRGTRLDIYREMVGKGDAAALAKLEKFRVARNEENVTRIKGELVIKSGNEQAPGTLEGNMGGL